MANLQLYRDTSTKATTSSIVSIFWRKTIVFENKAK